LDAAAVVRFRQHAVVAGHRLVLVDIDADSLPLMLDVGSHIAKSRDGIGLSVTATTDLDAGLDAPSTVITAFSVGGFSSMRHDLEIPARYGFANRRRQRRPGGVTRALRSIPVLLDIARTVERRALRRSCST